MSETRLELKTVSDVCGKLRIPSYQRGYRWEPRQVFQLLDDLKEHVTNNSAEPYYLQPVVVAPANPEELERLKAEERFDFDLIDGQQRLTTIFIIFKALEELKRYDRSTLNNMEIDDNEFDRLYGLYTKVSNLNCELNYELIYQTRTNTKKFLKTIANKSIDDTDVVDSPDHLYIYYAYIAVRNWIERDDNSEKIKDIADFLHNNTLIIWYELAESVESWKKFTDLNAGKIELTNSELIKAVFLNRSNQTIKDYEQDIVVSQWDRIENDLSDIEFWNFLTTEPQDKYPVKIDLLFNLVAGKTKKNEKDTYFTFNKLFSEIRANTNLTGKQKWDKIYSQYLRLRDWYADPWYYHRIGYLVAVGNDTTLLGIFRAAYPEGSKDGVGLKAFRLLLDEKVKESVALPQGVADYTKLRYNVKEEYDFLKKLLTLYNVMLCDKLSRNKVRYPFFKHNDGGDGGWTLEHIHAQNSDGLTTAKQWNEWVSDHLASLKNIAGNPPEVMKAFDSERTKKLISRMEGFSEKPSLEEFTDIANELGVLTAIKDSQDDDAMHTLENLALLSRDVNAGLNKSTFDVKRVKIAKRVSSNFVPIGTERVFMKSIAGTYKDENEKEISYACDGSQMYYWGDPDRKAYLHDIEETLKDYIEFAEVDDKQPQPKTEE